MTFVKADKGTTNNKNDKYMTPHKIAEQLCNLLPVGMLVVADKFNKAEQKDK